MNFKVCSCPHRDFNKETTLPTKKRGATQTPQGKHPSKMACLKTVKQEPNSSPAQVLIPQQSPADDSLLSPSSDISRLPSSPESPMTDSSVSITLKLPNLGSAQHVLQCAFNDVTGRMARDSANSNKYMPYARNIEKIMGKFLF